MIKVYSDSFAPLLPNGLTPLHYSVMLTLEVVKILKKLILLSSALALAFCSHLRPVCDFSLAGKELDCGCSPAAAKQAQEAALAAAEEILPGKAELPRAKTRLQLTLGKRADKAPALTDALLKNTEGVMAGCRVYHRAVFLGTVESREGFKAELDRYIENTLPSWAESGHVSSLGYKNCYTRSAYKLSDRDMIMLVTGLSPVMYTDGKGRVSPV